MSDVWPGQPVQAAWPGTPKDAGQGVELPRRGPVDRLLGLTGERYQTWPERAVRDIVSLPKQMMDAANSAPPGSREATEAMIGPAAETAMAVTGLGPGRAVLREGVKAGSELLGREAKQLAPTEKQLKAAYKTDYDISEKSGVTFHPESVKKFKDNIVSGDESSFHDEILSPKAFGIINKLAKGEGEKLTARTTVPEIDNVRKLLGRLAGGPDKYEREAATHFIKKIDTFMKDVPNLSLARANYAARERALLIEKAVKSAERRAQGSGTGANINNALRQEVRKIREKKSRGFTESELAEMDKIIAGTWTGDILRWLGKLAPTGILPTAGGLGVGSLMGSPLGAVGAMGLGTVAKTVSDRMTRNAIKKLSEKTRMRSPLAAKESEVRDYLKSQKIGQPLVEMPPAATIHPKEKKIIPAIDGDITTPKQRALNDEVRETLAASYMDATYGQSIMDVAIDAVNDLIKSGDLRSPEGVPWTEVRDAIIARKQTHPDIRVNSKGDMFVIGEGKEIGGYLSDNRDK